MISINLLPWRAQLEKQRQQDFWGLLIASLAGSFLVCLITHVCLTKIISHQLAANAYLQREITRVDKQINDISQMKLYQEDLLHRLFIIEGLQTDRALLVNLFYDVVNILPPGIYLTNIQRISNTLTLHGRAQSNQQISNFMKNMNAAASFENTTLTEIKNDHDLYLDSTNILNQIYTLGFEINTEQKNIYASSKGKHP